MVLKEGRRSSPIAYVHMLPATFDGRARMMVQNAMAAAAAAHAAGAHLHDIRQGLRSFTTSIYQGAAGRLNVFELDGVKVTGDHEFPRAAGPEPLVGTRGRLPPPRRPSRRLESPRRLVDRGRERTQALADVVQVRARRVRGGRGGHHVLAPSCGHRPSKVAGSMWTSAIGEERLPSLSTISSPRGPCSSTIALPSSTR